MSEQDKFQGWAIVELMGHRRLAGMVTEVSVAGAGMLRVDIPTKGDGNFTLTQFYPPSSLYALTPVAEDIARAVAKATASSPVHPWEMPLALPPAIDAEVDEDDDPDESLPSENQLRAALASEGTLKYDGDDAEATKPEEDDRPLLQACPFCGDKEALGVFCSADDCDETGSYWWVKCLNACGADGPCVPGKQSAINAWNRRPTAEILDAARRLVEEPPAEDDVRAALASELQGLPRQRWPGCLPSCDAQCVEHGPVSPWDGEIPF